MALFSQTQEVTPEKGTAGQIERLPSFLHRQTPSLQGPRRAQTGQVHDRQGELRKRVNRLGWSTVQQHEPGPQHLVPAHHLAE